MDRATGMRRHGCLSFQPASPRVCGPMKIPPALLKAVKINTLITDYGARMFREALARFVLEAESGSLTLHFNRVPVFHRLKYVTEDPYTAGGPEDSITSRSGKELAGRFNTALINDGSGGITGVNGYRVGQVRVVTPPPHVQAYYKVKRSLKDGVRMASIVSVANIRRSIHLLPKFGPIAPQHWT
ncbi:hypothetical protein R3P38DRAFT_3320667 [Favolaschia claudopus]|uniref:Uncharacterized protein n=1 Tax=Favolaschia claudopus TaxID=2862362 RepID=A0AAW0AWL7_9AGAR